MPIIDFESRKNIKEKEVNPEAERLHALLRQEQLKLDALCEEAFRNRQPLNSKEILEQNAKVSEIFVQYKAYYPEKYDDYDPRKDPDYKKGLDDDYDNDCDF